MQKSIELVKTDITTLDIDAIVNAANQSLLGGGGVDGAIHRAAGPDLLAECRKIGGCPTGEAKITKGYNLKAKYVIHTVGPIWKSGTENETVLLRKAYTNSLSIANEHRIKTIAFPNISTGVYGFPKQLAAEIAIKITRAFIEKNKYPQKVIFVCFDEENYNIYNAILKNN